MNIINKNKSLLAVLLMVIIAAIYFGFRWYSQKSSQKLIIKELRYTDIYLGLTKDELINRIDKINNNIRDLENKISERSQEKEDFENERMSDLGEFEERNEYLEPPEEIERKIDHYRVELEKYKNQLQEFEMNDPLIKRQRHINQDIEKINFYVNKLKINNDREGRTPVNELNFISGYYAHRSSLLKLPEIKIETQREYDQREYENIVIRLTKNLDKIKHSYQQDSTIIQAKIDEKRKFLINQIDNTKDNLNRYDEIKRKRDNLSETLDDQLIKSEYQSQLKNFSDAIEWYKKDKNMYNLKKSCYEIALLIKETQNRKWKEKLQNEIEALIQTHNSLVNSIQEIDSELLEYQIAAMQKGAQNIYEKIASIESLIDVVKPIFEGGLFFEYFQISKSDLSENKPEVRPYIEAFKAAIPALKEFLEYYSDYKIHIDGHADRLPFVDDPYGNMKLSRERAIEAKKRLTSQGISQTFIVCDWFGEFHNTTDKKADRGIGIARDRRIDLRLIGGESDSTQEKKIYSKFRNAFKVPEVGKTFFHEEGYWVETGYIGEKYEIISLNYAGKAFDALFKKNKTFAQLVKKHASPLYRETNGTIQLGNQIKLKLEIEGTIFNIEVNQNGFLDIEEITNSKFRNYLL
ncbi:MAG: OmpA family protein [Candidatus Lokiarchaeota archaeon]|nr:OmpA family protein [Candidatus Lokiarchaeota archaeon]